MAAAPNDDAALQQLLARVALQDRAALRTLYDATAGRLLAIVQRMLDDRAAAEDVIQDTFVAVWQRAPQFPQLRTSPLAWLTTIARHRAIDLLRRRRPETPLAWTDDEDQEHQHDVADPGAAPPEQIEQQQDDGRLAWCVGRLADEPRQAVLLAYYEGLTHEQLALRLRRPLGTVKTWVRRSLQQLKACLEGAEATI
ncbi:MAG: sigma-70 family RNA polymerase sigma factor [Rubrivivax sp.]